MVTLLTILIYLCGGIILLIPIGMFIFWLFSVGFGNKAYRKAKLLEKEKKYKVKFLEPFFKSNDKSTRFTTLQLKKELFHSLKNKFPQFEKDITKEWGIYKDKKEVKVGNKSERDDRKK